LLFSRDEIASSSSLLGPYRPSWWKYQIPNINLQLAFIPPPSILYHLTFLTINSLPHTSGYRRLSAPFFPPSSAAAFPCSSHSHPSPTLTRQRQQKSIDIIIRPKNLIATSSIPPSSYFPLHSYSPLTIPHPHPHPHTHTHTLQTKPSTSYSSPLHSLNTPPFFPIPTYKLHNTPVHTSKTT